MLNRSKLWATGLLFAVFVSGVALGGAASAAWGDRSEPDGRRGERESYAQRLERALNLTEAQGDSVARIVEPHQETMRSFWREIRPRYEEFRAQLRADVMEILTEEQRETYQVLIAQSDSARAVRRRGRHERK